MADSLIYKLRSGKPSKLLFFIKGYLKMLVPRSFYIRRKEKLLSSASQRGDYLYILERVDYYIKMSHRRKLPSDPIHENKCTHYVFLDRNGKFRPSTFHKAYFFDLTDVMRYFNRNLRIGYIPGDVYFTPEFPAIVKSRLLHTGNHNSVLLKLDKLRHFMFVDDKIPFSSKKPTAIFRGKIRLSRLREKFMTMYFGSDICDCGIVADEGYPKEWLTPKKTIREHLEYRYIIALEGNDVASNLKWVMSSNSIAIMTKPTCETWFMEGRLIPNYHYIEIKDDLSDLRERIEFYNKNPEKAEEIIQHAHDYVRQFFNKKREKLISLLVAERYFNLTSQ